jgi:hypothetical protein
MPCPLENFSLLKLYYSLLAPDPLSSPWHAQPTLYHNESDSSMCLKFYFCIHPVLVRFLFLHEHHDQEASWGGKGLFCLYFHTAVHHQRKSGLELKQVKKQELMQMPWRDVPYWLASPDLLCLLAYRTQDYQPRDGTMHKGPSPLDH